MAHTELIPILPGDFRAQYSRNLADGDVFIAVSQSGETKDLIDVLNGVMATGRDVFRVGVVNNVSSTLGQEKCQLVIPLHPHRRGDFRGLRRGRLPPDSGVARV